MFCRLFLLVALFSSMTAYGAIAKPVSIEGTRPRDRVTLHVDKASVATVLKHMSERYAFKVAGLKHIKERTPLSLTMSGNVYSLIKRLLRNRDYLIVRSAKNKSGVERVVILNSAFGTRSERSPGTIGPESFSQKVPAKQTVER